MSCQLIHIMQDLAETIEQLDGFDEQHADRGGVGSVEAPPPPTPVGERRRQAGAWRTTKPERRTSSPATSVSPDARTPAAGKHSGADEHHVEIVYAVIKHCRCEICLESSED